MYRYFVKLAILACFPFLLMAANSNISKEIEEIDKRIKNLEKILDANDIEKFNESTESQAYMIADWPRYAKETEDIREKDLKEQQLLQDIRALKERKRQLLLKYNE